MLSFIRASSVALLLSVVMASAQSPTEGLVGRIDGFTYISPEGHYQVQIPVLPDLGGTVSDTPTVVVFRDDYGTHVSIGAFPQDAMQRWELSTRGLKEYLPHFFANFVLPDFRQMFPGTSVESAVFQPQRLGGALLCYTLMPGGTMFPSEVANFGTEEELIVAKRGNLVFVQNNVVYVVSVELSERSLEGRSYDKTPEEEDKILRERLKLIVDEIEFSQPRE